MQRKITLPFLWLFLLLVLSGMVVIQFYFSGSEPIPAEVVSSEHYDVIKTPLYNDVLAKPIRSFLRTFTNPTEIQTDLFSGLENDSLTLSERRNIAFKLAMTPSRSIILELGQLFPILPSYVKAAIAEGLGENPHPDAKQLLLTLLRNERTDAIAMRGLIRGAATLGDDESLGIIADIVSDSERVDSVREEAARELGVNKNPMAFKLLTDAFEHVDDPELEINLLEGLGNLSVNETSDFFQAYLTSNEIPEELRVAAVEALVNSPDDASSLLMQFASDQNPEVRAAAAWALSGTQTTENNGALLTELLAQESDANVRKYLYQALTNQTDINADQIIELVKVESSIDTRVAGYHLMASIVNQAVNNEELENYFNSSVVSELKTIALNGNKAQQLTSVLALSQAKSPEANEALHQITITSNDESVIHAANNALGHNNE